MARTAWTITDNSTGSAVVYTFTINPNSFTPPNRRATIVQESTVSAAGGLIVFQGREKAGRGKLSGIVTSQSDYLALKAEFDKWYPLDLADDLGNTWTVIFTGTTWTREKRKLNPWHFTYTTDFMVVT